MSAYESLITVTMFLGKSSMQNLLFFYALSNSANIFQIEVTVRKLNRGCGQAGIKCVRKIAVPDDCRTSRVARST